jgi:hypothetical protein
MLACRATEKEDPAPVIHSGEGARATMSDDSGGSESKDIGRYQIEAHVLFSAPVDADRRGAIRDDLHALLSPKAPSSSNRTYPVWVWVRWDGDALLAAIFRVTAEGPDKAVAEAEKRLDAWAAHGGPEHATIMIQSATKVTDS